ncbi:hypothetical protein GDO78_014653 [Eleutherodactylus coqui]|uniref:Uncharacterized protein n=1 Tax=Eleutherodactylus coqui TaxID=57060 RepID=A0A8J6BGN6_ELECQ|nr:hypothetical protein GDO78_014653 [Eleutherodactylus coqui]
MNASPPCSVIGTALYTNFIESYINARCTQQTADVCRFSLIRNILLFSKGKDETEMLALTSIQLDHSSKEHPQLWNLYISNLRHDGEK